MNSIFEPIAVVAVISILAFGIITILKLALEHLKRTRTEKLQSELFNKMLDKFGGNQELIAWLESGGGQGLLRAAEAPKPAAYTRILNSVQAGLLVIMIGAGFVVVSGKANPEAVATVHSIGMVLITAGAGLLAGGLATYILSRKFGLINGEQG